MNEIAQDLFKDSNDWTFSERELAAFLSQPLPRDVPQALKLQSSTNTADLLGLFAGAGGVFLIPIIGAPLLLWEKIGIWSVVLSLTLLVMSAVLVTRLLKWIRDLPTLLKDGVLTTGRFDEVEFVHSHDGTGRPWQASLQFEVDGQLFHVNRTLSGSYGELAAWLCDSKTDIPILFKKESPKNAQWAGELVYPCPKPPEPE